MPPDTERDRSSNRASVEHRDGRELKAGAARVDITPETGNSFQGYVRPDIRSDGVDSRLFARALVLEDGRGKVGIVSADLLHGTDKDGLVERLRPLGFDEDSLMYAGTHTHASTDAGDWTTERIAEAVAEADASVQPAVAGWGSATVSGVSQNRSLEAHLANHGKDLSPGTATPDEDPQGSGHPRDEIVDVLRIDDVGGEPIAVWTEFAVHPTAFPPSNTLYSSDLVGVAFERFSDALNVPLPTLLFGNRASGDQIPVYDGYNKHAVAEKNGERIADGMMEAWENAGGSLSSDFPVSACATTAKYDGQEVGPGKRVARRGVFGLPFLGGAENGPSPLYGLGLEGRRRPKVLAGDVHGRKIPVAPTPWDSEVEAQVVRLGDTVLLCAPGEPTVETGRRWSEAVDDVVTDAVSDVRVLGLTNGYNGYFTTPEEYDQQHYEGGHTVFGKHTEALLRKTYVQLSSRIDDSGDKERRENGSATNETDGIVEENHYRAGGAGSGSLLSQPSESVERMSVVAVEWSGGRKGRDMPLDEPLVRLERLTENGWEVVATDLNHGLVWKVKDGEYAAMYEVPREGKTGRHRFRVTADAYELMTEEFKVVPSTDLRVLGAELKGGAVVFRAQNPPPNPDRHLRSRRRRPTGGKVEFELDGERRIADWDEDSESWTAEVDASRGDELKLPDGALVDCAGNRSGSGKRVNVDEVDDVSWYSDMKSGGGRPPGPFGVGEFPT